MNIASQLEAIVGEHADRTAVVYLGSRITYGRLGRYIERAAAGFARLGVVAGDRVVVYLPNGPQWVVTWAALQRLGATVVPVTPFYGERELAYVCQDSASTTIVCTDVNYGYVAAIADEAGVENVVVTSMIDMLPAWKRGIGRLLDQVPRGSFPRNDGRTSTFRALVATSGDLPPADHDPAAIAEIMYTGGTTGEPKGVPISRGQFLAAAAEQRRQSMPVVPLGEDVVLQGAPLFHILGQTVGLGALLAGDTLVLLPRMNLDAVMDHIDRFRATTLFGVPTFFRMVLEHDRLDDYSLASLRYCFSGGDVLPVEVGRRWHDRVGTRIVQGYGATETCGGITLTPAEEAVPDGTVGRLLPLHEVLVVQPGTTDPVEPGGSGELLVHSEPMVDGYYNKPAETELAFVTIDGKRWYRTGDVVRFDDDGWCYFVDRSVDTIKHKGYRVAASKVEAVLQAHPSVLSACVVGVPDERVGERVKALIVVKADATDVSVDEIQQWCNQRLARYERPSAFEFRDMLPTSKVGKLLRREIRDEERRRRGISAGEAYLAG
ncbi:class I adenylate-forming enzyme family protein [Nitriliruptor alkaliphilus]|uniref:class I adenylate-forming enzyme family protein n=1 Tax=Nitriliruptor alkaliphilus TaxID=427918 RepID=UPI0006983085|nr:class I adenylate-forming enzyme family protein [Nitriliruptor alkaliphilus]